MIPQGDIEVDVTCPKCGNVSREPLSPDGVVETIPRPMGYEKVHQWSNDDYECEVCGANGTVEHRKWEYPEGEVNHEETKVYLY